MKMLIGIVLCFLSTLSWAQQGTAVDGNWIKKGIDAFDRVNVTRNGTDEDTLDSRVLISYVSGMLAVHRLNNLLASLVIGASNQPSGKARREKQSANNAMHVRTALAFTPLLAIPDELTPQQIVAVLRKYLDAHPEKWGTNAPLLITEALEVAFAKK